MIDLSRYTRTITNYAVLYGMKIVIALLILIIGLWLIRRITNLLHRLMEKRGVDASLIPFLSNIVNILLKIMLIIIVISQIGIEATSFLAILGSAGIAIGLALQGSLSNFAGGVLLLTLRPFRVGDFIDAQGQSGKVHIINIFNTVIKTGDNKTIFIPNGPLASGTIVNYDLEEKRRVDLKFSIPAGKDVNKTRDIIYNLAAQDLRILKEPAPKIVVSETTGANVTLLVRVWANHEDYWDVYYSLQENIKDALHKEDIV
ncbi:mechanosensitive ion channel family protein [Adhaeribacter terreus]|uniref:Mechanosensitive ion channel family protein n=1 Tax=Adhaeribacter terreus TaxID=529703 RepID=A0ABW0EG37_9BACT